MFDADEECDCFATVDQAVIVREGDVHHWADDDLSVERDGAVLDGMHAEDAALGWVYDRR